MGEDRRRLADDQATLLAALIGGGPLPPGFDAERLKAAGKVLVAKRASGIARACPVLPEALGDRFAERFAAYALETPLGTDGAKRDGLGFATWLRRRGELSEPAWRSVLARRSRPGLPLIVCREPSTGGMVVALRLPGARLVILARPFS